MDDLCIHCGHPAEVDDFGVLVHRDGKLGAPQMCLDGSGHIACLYQAGVE